MSPRIQYEGAIYHVMSRGDRREAITLDGQDRKMFLKTLEEACQRAGFVVYSYVLMNNHYHLLLQTPEGNLVDGMRWLQSTYTARFNARHRQRGHLFQGRYKAIPIQDDETHYLRTLSDYIHLNPARAGIMNASSPELKNYPWSSFPAICGKGEVPSWLKTDDLLKSHGWESRSSHSRQEYEGYLQDRAQACWEEKSTKTPRARAEFERNFNLLHRQIEDGRFHIAQELSRSLDGLDRVRFLPNGRINFLSVDETVRLQANMMANMSEGFFEDQFK